MSQPKARRRRRIRQAKRLELWSKRAWNQRPLMLDGDKHGYPGYFIMVPQTKQGQENLAKFAQTTE